MFQWFGNLVSRTWYLWLVGWCMAFALLYWSAPPWHEVAQDREFGFLPEDAPSYQGQVLFNRAFPHQKQVSNIVIVLSREHEDLRPEDRAFVRSTVTPALARAAKENGGLLDEKSVSANDRSNTKSIVAAIHTPDDPGSGALLISANRRAMLVMLELSTELLEQRNWPLIEKTESLISQWQSRGQVPNGLNISLIGSALVGRDMTKGSQQSAQATEFWTVAIVIVILLLIYRAPLLAMIPLLAVFVATQISVKLLSILARAEIVTVYEGIETYITVILYGTGVDYCMFLIARYQEEREHGADWPDALARALGHVGPALAASAATVLFGIGMMVFAKFGKFHHAGIAVAISLAISFCVMLTFTPSVLRLAGRWAFWPKSVEPSVGHEAIPSQAGWLSWDGLGNALLRRPALIWLVTVLLMMPLAVGGVLYADHIDYDFVRRLPPDAPSVVGTKALQENFPAGAAGTVTVLIYHPDLDFLAPDGPGQIELAGLTNRLGKQLSSLQLADVRSWSRPLGNGFAARQATGAPLSELTHGLERALKYYVSSTGDLKGHVTRMELTMLQNPMSRPGIASLNQIEEAVRSDALGELHNAKFYFLGVTADMRDLRAVTGSDQVHIQILVVACVLTILLILLRRPVVSLYLIISVLFSYFATLGAAQLFFWWLTPNDFAGLDWKTPLFLFTILVAIGEDYNIFLMTRVAEEQAHHGPIEGIRVAVVRTGRIITSCGIIMAGTFASLLFGSMQDLQHLGFALAFGVLVDTFIVRPILVPAFLVILERGRLLWQKLSLILEKTSEEPEPTSHH